MRSDNGPEFVASAILRWLEAAQIETALIDPGKPWQNGADESFNGKFRDEFLSLQWLRNRTEARVGIEQWRRHYNEVRPHSSLGYRAPPGLRGESAETQRGRAELRVDENHRPDPQSAKPGRREGRVGLHLCSRRLQHGPLAAVVDTRDRVRCETTRATRRESPPRRLRHTE